VQQLVPADVEGDLFTANPLNGVCEQIVINAAWGLGEAIVGGLVTPDTSVINKQPGAVDSSTIADKEVMTVRLPVGTHEEPVPAGRRRQPALEPRQAAELAKLGVQIEQLYGQPMDVEWVLCGERLFILQARPITALPEPRAALDWTLPRAEGRYVRKAVAELLPDPLSPLFATLALPFWNESMRELMKRIGAAMRIPEHMAMLTTINDYAYYDFGLRALQWARLMSAMPGLIRRISPELLRRAEARWADEARPHYAGVVGKWAAVDLNTMPSTELLEGANEIVRAAADHYLVIESGILPSAFISEALFTAAYKLLARRKGDPPAVTFMLGFDSAPIQAEKSLYDLAVWARTQPEAVIRLESSQEFSRRFAEHLNRFGHAVYDLDFARSVPADEPAPVLETIKYFMTGQARSPYERQAAAAAAREQATHELLARLKGLRLRLFTRLLKWAQRYAPLREDALADVGLGWPLLRRMLRELGRRFVAAGMVAERDDVFWLKLEEAKAAARSLDANQSVSDCRPLVAERRSKWERERTATPPVMLPHGVRFMGIDFSSWQAARTNQAAGDAIKGQAASPGCASGVARVIHGPDEFNRMRPGDILVAKITTPAWTTLFALAAAVVTDVGGPLSHGSIVAREYHIPAVLGTGVATERIRDGQRITVDGGAGVVKLNP